MQYQINFLEKIFLNIIAIVGSLFVLALNAFLLVSVGLIFGLGVGILLFHLGGNAIVDLFCLFNVHMEAREFYTLCSLIGAAAAFAQNEFAIPFITIEEMNDQIDKYEKGELEDEE